MEEKNEQLRLTKSRWKLLKQHTGQNIINSFQKINLNDEEENPGEGSIDNYYYSTESFETLSDDEFQIEQILMEAGAYGLRNEVDHYAKSLIEKNPLSSRVDAYVKAYHEIIKD